MKGLNVKRFLSLSLSLLLAGCPMSMQPGAKPGDPNPLAQTQQGLVANNAAGFSGHVRIPSQLISNNSAGLIANNAAGLVANNAAGYRTATLSEVALANSLVYLLNPDEQFYADASGKRYVTTTNGSGDYQVPNALPANTQVLVTAMLSGNRRMVGYALAQEGDNKVNISVASTYATEFFRAQAAKSNKTMADYHGAMDKLTVIIDETQKLLDDGKLPIPDLTIGKALDMNRAYFAAFGSQSQRLSDLWADLLGRRLIALTTLAGNYALGSIQEPGSATEVGLNMPTGVAVDPAGNVYIAEQVNHIIRKVAPDGSSTIWGTFKGDGSIATPSLSTASVTPLANFSIPNPLAVACDPDGNVIVVLANVKGAAHNSVLMFVCQKAGNHYGKTMTAGNVYRLGHDDPSDEPSPDTNPPIYADPASPSAYNVSRYRDGAIDQARFQEPQAICSDDVGNLYVADRLNNLIRRIDRTTGTVSTVAGKLKTDANGTFGDQHEDWDGASNGDNGTALGAILDRPFSVAWRRVDNNTQELFIWEGTKPSAENSAVKYGGNAIRRIRITGSDYAGGTISTLAGGSGKRGPNRGETNGDGELASAAKLRLVDPDLSQDVPAGGLALSPDGRYLYVCDSLNFRIRVLDLNSANGPTIDTLAGGGEIEGNTEARLAKVKGVSGLAVDSTGAVYFCDEISHVVRKINVQFGR